MTNRIRTIGFVKNVLATIGKRNTAMMVALEEISRRRPTRELIAT